MTAPFAAELLGLYHRTVAAERADHRLISIAFMEAHVRGLLRITDPAELRDGLTDVERVARMAEETAAMEIDRPRRRGTTLAAREAAHQAAVEFLAAVRQLRAELAGAP